MKTPLNTWKIAYTITAGGHEYGDYLLREAGQMTAAEAATLVAAFWYRDADPEEEAALRRALTDDGYAYLPDGRLISELSWEMISPIVVTVRDGLVVSVRQLPVDVTVEVQDWDNGELDEEGKPVPTVSEWTGPL